MSEEYEYEQCIVATMPALKKRGVEDYDKMAANLCRMRVEEGTARALRARRKEAAKEE